MTALMFVALAMPLILAIAVGGILWIADTASPKI